MMPTSTTAVRTTSPRGEKARERNEPTGPRVRSVRVPRREVGEKPGILLDVRQGYSVGTPAPASVVERRAAVRDVAREARVSLVPPSDAASQDV